MTNHPPESDFKLGWSVGAVWLVAGMAVPLLVFVVAPLGTLLGVRGPCGEFEPTFGAVIAVYVGVPSGLALTLALLVARTAGVRRGSWIRILMAVYAVAAVGFAVYFSAMCK